MTGSLAPEGVERFRSIVSGSLGLAFEPSRAAWLGAVLNGRATALGLSAESYLEQLERAGLEEEAGPLAEQLTVGESYFFRNGGQLRAFREFALPDRLRESGRRHLNLLSAGCSSGEEAYTLAILAREAVPMPPWSVSVRAVDVNPSALDRAKSGRFSSWALRDTPESSRQKWFVREGRDFVVDGSLRGAVHFSRSNLAEDDPEIWQPDCYDAVFCRNVIMYFTPAVAAAVIARVERSLRPGGFLFLGDAETLRGLSQGFHLIHTHGAFFYQRKRWAEEPRLDPSPRWDGPAWPPLPHSAPSDASWVDTIGGASRRIAALAECPAPPAAAPKPIRAGLSASLELLRRERFAEALSTIRAMPAEARLDRDIMLLEAAILAHGGRGAEAAELCRQLLASDELNAGANYVLALCFEQAGDAEAASHHCRVSAYLEPGFAMPRLHLGLLARRSGHPARARSELELALLLLRQEDPARLLLFGGGFGRDALIALCEAELRLCGSRS